MIMIPSSSFMMTFVVVATLFAIPTGMVLKRTGHAMWWALLCYIPIAALLGLWVLAFSRWRPAAE
jgi:hypothetical protein